MHAENWLFRALPGQAYNINKKTGSDSVGEQVEMSKSIWISINMNARDDHLTNQSVIYT